MKQVQTIKIVAVSLLLAVVMAFVSEPGGERIRNGLFFLHIGRSVEEQRVREAVNAYNSAVNGIYISSGLVFQELAVIPATQLEKRKIYKDVNALRSNGRVLLFDKDKLTVERVEFPSSTKAFALSKEVWTEMFQDLETHKPLSRLKGSRIRSRYHLNRTKDGWMVANVEVFPPDEAIPQLNYGPSF